MKICVKCGSQLEDCEAVCKNCGAVQPVAAGYSVERKKNRCAPYFIWSLVLILALNPIGTPLGIISSVFACAANSHVSADGSAADFRMTKTLCIAATVVDFLTLLIAGAAIVASIAGGSSFINQYLTGY